MTEKTKPEDSRKQAKLSFFNELDPWQQDNHFICSAYVKQTSSYSECIKSLTYLHNESINIYTHLLPAALALNVTILYWLRGIESHEAPLWIGVSYLLFAFGASICLTSSALFHLFKSHSSRVCNFGNQCDYFGIVIMITNSLISVILFVFDDLPMLKTALVTIFLGLGFTCTFLTFDSKFSTPLYRPMRSLIFVLFGLSGVIPIVLASSILGPREAYDRSCAGWLIMEGFFYILGAALYAARFPERYVYKRDYRNKNVHGKFDVFGHSHQIFHIMVVIAATCHFNALLNCHIHWRSRNPHFVLEM